MRRRSAGRWATARNMATTPAWTRPKLTQLYEILEQQVIPEYYDAERGGSFAGLGRTDSRKHGAADAAVFRRRTVLEYTEQHYLPRAQAYLERSKDKGKAGADLLAWRRQVEEHWPRVRFGWFNSATDEGQHSFSIQVWLDELAPDAVAVELYADGQGGNAPLRYPMTRGQALAGAESGYTWTAKIPADRPAGDFTARVVPSHAGAQVPLECSQILWYR